MGSSGDSSVLEIYPGPPTPDDYQRVVPNWVMLAIFGSFRLIYSNYNSDCTMKEVLMESHRERLIMDWESFHSSSLLYLVESETIKGSIHNDHTRK